MSVKQRLEKAFGKIEKSKWQEAAETRRQNAAWLKYSRDIAFDVAEFLDENEMTQKEFAERLQVSPQAVCKWLKGGENFTLETISKIEGVLGIRLLQTGRALESAMELTQSMPDIAQQYMPPGKRDFNFGKSTAIIIPMRKDYTYEPVSLAK